MEPASPQERKDGLDDRSNPLEPVGWDEALRDPAKRNPQRFASAPMPELPLVVPAYLASNAGLKKVTIEPLVCERTVSGAVIDERPTESMLKERFGGGEVHARELDIIQSFVLRQFERAQAYS